MRANVIQAERTRRVLLVGNFLSASGGSRGVCEDLAIRLATAGWDVIATSSRPARLPRLLDMAHTVWRRRHDYDVAHVDVYSGPAFLWAEVVAWTLRRAGKPYVLTLHGGNLPAFARRWPGRVRRLLASAGAVTAPSPYLLESMRPYRDDLLLVPNPLDLPAYEFRQRRAVRPSLVWLRALHSIYNPTLAPRVVALLARDWPDAHLRMVGPDKGDGSLAAVRRTADELGVAERVELVGQVAKGAVPGWLQKGDVFLNTTNVDNTPVSVLEAMACGLCVVSTRVGGLPYLLADGQDALLVPPDDAEAMAAAVRRLLTEPELAAWLSGNARRKAEQHDWAKLTPRWESLLVEVASRG